MERNKVLFFTYYRTTPTGQIGVFKRCIRLMPHLFNEFEIHLVNYGPLPANDSLFNEIRKRIRIHTLPESELGVELHILIESLSPLGIVFGETPLRGNMWLAYHVASSFSCRLLCIENYYGDFARSYLPAQWARIDRWLLLGLLPDAQAQQVDGCITILPPLVGFSPTVLPRDRICILAYDEQTLFTAIQIMTEWPERRIDLIVSHEWRILLERQLQAQPGKLTNPHLLDNTLPNVRLLELPPEAIIYDSLARATLVIGKAGFQQIVEAICLGAPILCRICGGGVTRELIPTYLQPFVLFIDEHTDISVLLDTLPDWLKNLPLMPWKNLSAASPLPTPRAAQILSAMLLEDPPQVQVVDALSVGWPFGDDASLLYSLCRMVEHRQWNCVAAILETTQIVVDKHTYSSKSFAEYLRIHCDRASCLKVLPLARLTSNCFRCCLILGSADSWKVREIEFDACLLFDEQHSYQLQQLQLTPYQQ